MGNTTDVYGYGDTLPALTPTMNSFLTISLALCYAISSLAEQRHLMIGDVGNNGKTFLEHFFLQIPARSALNCALACSQVDKCLAFTFGDNSCRLHSERSQSPDMAIESYIPGTRLYYKDSFECGTDLIATSSEQSLDMYGQAYHYNAHCVWPITASPGQNIWMDIPYMDVIAYADCESDNIRVSYMHTNGSMIAEKFCGEHGISEPIISESNVATVVFTSIVSELEYTWTTTGRYRSGFMLLYKAV
ncbi:uncharacterized protein [Littorina saxatilis]|uniref:uncharacterized protein isoform X2 n=1 Tax=Littorina saxatilis TaxID=31220 RepID=UPI0038B4AC3B